LGGFFYIYNKSNIRTSDPLGSGRRKKIAPVERFLTTGEGCF